MPVTIQTAISSFRASAKRQLAHASASGEPEDQHDRRPPSPLGNIQSDHWLINVLKVLRWPVKLGSRQAVLLEKISAVPIISARDFPAVDTLVIPAASKAKGALNDGSDLFTDQT